MDVSVRKAGTAVVVQLNGRVDESGARTLKEKLGEIEPDGIKELVFDFKGVTRIGSAGIGQLLLAYKNQAVAGGTLRVENLSPQVYELFQNLKLDTLFTIRR